MGPRSTWSVTSTFNSVTGAACALRDEGVTWSRWESIGERLPLRIEQSDATIRLFEDWGPMGMEYEGERFESRFIVVAPNPPRTFRCSDGTAFDDVVCKLEVVGQFSEDEIELKATRRYLCRQLDTDLEVLTVTWTWSGTRP